MNTSHIIETARLASDFLNGNLYPKEFTLEDEMVFEDADLESIVMRYGHGECHDWTYALTEACPSLDVHYILLGGEVIHSFVANQSGTLALDSNGIHLFEKVKEYWQVITTEICTVVNMRDFKYSLEELLAPELEDIEDAHANIALWYKKTEQHFKSQEG